MTHTAIHPLTEKPQKPNPDTQLSTSVFSFNIIDKKPIFNGHVFVPIYGNGYF